MQLIVIAAGGSVAAPSVGLRAFVLRIVEKVGVGGLVEVEVVELEVVGFVVAYSEVVEQGVTDPGVVDLLVVET